MHRRRLTRSCASLLLSLEVPCTEKRGQAGLRRRIAFSGRVAVRGVPEAVGLPFTVVIPLRH